MPWSASVFGVAVRFASLTAAHGPLRSAVCGIDHAPLDQVTSTQVEEG